jgi:hypothetical protein
MFTRRSTLLAALLAPLGLIAPKRRHQACGKVTRPPKPPPCDFRYRTALCGRLLAIAAAWPASKIAELTAAIQRDPRPPVPAKWRIPADVDPAVAAELDRLTGELGQCRASRIGFPTP